LVGKENYEQERKKNRRIKGKKTRAEPTLSRPE